MPLRQRLASSSDLKEKNDSRDSLVESTITQKYAKVEDYDAHFKSTFKWLMFYTTIGFATRFYNISASNRVTWDEAHFGKFGSYYLAQTFYFDVHPPLGKMLVALGMLLSGFTGGFGFESGSDYNDVNYTGMRIFCALFGSAIIPFAYLTATELPLKPISRHVLAWSMILETGLNVISRFILLDPFLLCFNSASLYFFVKMCKYPIGYEKLYFMTLLGISLGAVLSVKWVGLFMVALVGINTIVELWHHWGNLNMPLNTYLSHWAIRAFSLILVPIAFYTFMYVIHFAILTKSGSGDSHMSSLWQASLKGSDLIRNPLYVAIGSTITLKNTAYSGGLLHSHAHRYPSGSEQQQVTAYHFRDNNNRWQIFPNKHQDHPIEYDASASREYNEQLKQQLTFLRHQDEIRLVHTTTHRNLHSHPVQGPVSKFAYEVSCYGNTTFGDANDLWVVDIVEELIPSEEDFNPIYPDIGQVDHSLEYRRVKALTTQFKLRHKQTGCLLGTHPKALPEWGFKQHEVVCFKDVDDSRVIWNVEHHYNELLPAGTPRHYKTSLMRDIVHHNVAQWSSNNALVADPNKVFYSHVGMGWLSESSRGLAIDA